MADNKDIAVLAKKVHELTVLNPDELEDRIGASDVARSVSQTRRPASEAPGRALHDHAGAGHSRHRRRLRRRVGVAP